jgi:putative ABC transport system permease protein
MMMHPIVEQYDNVPEVQKPIMTSSLIVVMSPQNIGATMKSVQDTIARFDPNFNFEPLFLEDRLNDLYEAESNLMNLTGVFSGICIFISVMGLFGLAAFTTEQRTKEIGIRKVLGASDEQIVTMLSRNLLVLVVIAAVPSSIVSYYVIDKWLQRFAYQTEIAWVTFVLSTLAVAAVALATVVLQSLKTARADPVNALRYE